ncbi:hypothetical protein CVE31_28935, partial [Pseudomonas syringae pv. actinidiae]|nr:hypothetical protein [Pseudomonas syringae pv. actinidiae]
MKNVVTQPLGIHFPVLSLDLPAGVQCCAF